MDAVKTQNETVCFDNVDAELLYAQYKSLIDILSQPEFEDHILWGVVEMFGDALDSKFGSMIESDL
jgi:hypothetical protein